MDNPEQIHLLNMINTGELPDHSQEHGQMTNIDNITPPNLSKRVYTKTQLYLAHTQIILQQQEWVRQVQPELTTSLRLEALLHHF